MTATLVHRYQPRGACLAAFRARDDEVLVSGPAGTGKSRACLEKLHACALANPGMRGLIVRKTAESLSTTALVTWEKHVVPEALEGKVLHFYGGSAKEPPQYRYANGSVIVIGGMNKASRIMSTEYDMVYVQEGIELTRLDWESLTTRMRNGVMSFQQMLCDTNPDTPTHWLYQRSNAGSTRMIESRHTDNPRYYDEMPLDVEREPGDVERDGKLYRITPAGASYMGKLNRLTGTRLLRLRDGKWVAAEGLVYEEWDPAVHLVDAFPIPDDWRRLWSVDFGFRHPFVCSMWAVAPDGELHRYREHFGTGRTVGDWAERMLASVRRPRAKTKDDPSGWEPDWTKPGDWEWTEPRPAAIICDHDAEGRVVLQRALGQGTVPAHKKVKEGIDAVKERMKANRIFLHRGALVEVDPQLVEDVKPTCTEEEIPGYRWDERKEAPVKIQDDGCDMMRYVVAHEDLTGRPNVRFL